MNRKPGKRGHSAETVKTVDLPTEGRVQVARSSKRLLTNGVVLMAGAALLSKLIGVFQKIPLQNLAGDRVFGIYNAVYPFYQLAAVLATAGLPTAVSLLIAERLRKGDDPEGVRRTLYAALLLLGVTGIAAFGFMWSAADQAGRLDRRFGDGCRYTLRFVRAAAGSACCRVERVCAGARKNGIVRCFAGCGANDTRRLLCCLSLL